MPSRDTGKVQTDNTTITPNTEGSGQGRKGERGKREKTLLLKVKPG